MDALQLPVPAATSKLLNTRQAMEYLGVGRNKMYELMHRRDFPGFRLSDGGPWRVSQKALDEWIAKQSQPRQKA